MIPNDGADAMHTCGVLLACRDDEAAPPLSWAVLASSEARMWSPTVVPMPVRMWCMACAS